MTKDGLEKEISQENNLLVRPDLVGWLVDGKNRCPKKTRFSQPAAGLRSPWTEWVLKSANWWL
jgi:hypothetical protein